MRSFSDVDILVGALLALVIFAMIGQRDVVAASDWIYDGAAWLVNQVSTVV